MITSQLWLTVFLFCDVVRTSFDNFSIMFWLLVNYNNSNKESRIGRKFCNKTKLVSTKGLSLIKSWGFPLAVMNKAHGYFCGKQKENNIIIM